MIYIRHNRVYSNTEMHTEVHTGEEKTLNLDHPITSQMLLTITPTELWHWSRGYYYYYSNTHKTQAGSVLELKAYSTCEGMRTYMYVELL